MAPKARRAPGQWPKDAKALTEDEDATIGHDGNENICGSCQNPGTLICCDGCVAAFHATCTGYADEDDIPDGDWLCWSCSGEGQRMFHPVRPATHTAGDQVFIANLDSFQMFRRARVTSASKDKLRLEFLDGGPRERHTAAEEPAAVARHHQRRCLGGSGAEHLGAKGAAVCSGQHAPGQGVVCVGARAAVGGGEQWPGCVHPSAQEAPETAPAPALALAPTSAILVAFGLVVATAPGRWWPGGKPGPRTGPCARGRAGAGGREGQGRTIAAPLPPVDDAAAMLITLSEQPGSGRGRRGGAAGRASGRGRVRGGGGGRGRGRPPSLHVASPSGSSKPPSRGRGRGSARLRGAAARAAAGGGRNPLTAALRLRMSQRRAAGSSPLSCPDAKALPLPSRPVVAMRQFWTEPPKAKRVKAEEVEEEEPPQAAAEEPMERRQAEGAAALGPVRASAEPPAEAGTKTVTVTEAGEESPDAKKAEVKVEAKVGEEGHEEQSGNGAVEKRPTCLLLERMPSEELLLEGLAGLRHPEGSEAARVDQGDGAGGLFDVDMDALAGATAGWAVGLQAAEAGVVVPLVHVPVEVEVAAEATVEADVQAPMEAEVEAPMEAEAEEPVEAEVPMEAEAPMEAPLAAEAAVQMEVEAQAPVEAPVEAEALMVGPVEADVPVVAGPAGGRGEVEERTVEGVAVAEGAGPTIQPGRCAEGEGAAVAVEEEKAPERAGVAEAEAEAEAAEAVPGSEGGQEAEAAEGEGACADAGALAGGRVETDEGGSEPGKADPEAAAFLAALRAFLKKRDGSFTEPRIAARAMCHWELWRDVTGLGGHDAVGASRQWTAVGRRFGAPKTLTSTGLDMRKSYVGAGLLELEQALRRGETVEGVVLPAELDPAELDEQSQPRPQPSLPARRRSGAPRVEAPTPELEEFAELLQGEPGVMPRCGDEVEVRALTKGLRGAWVPGRVVDTATGSQWEGGHRFLVTADLTASSTAGSSGRPPMCEWVPLVHRGVDGQALPHPLVALRRSWPAMPPPTAALRGGARVEGHWGGAWWAGTLLPPERDDSGADTPSSGEGPLRVLMDPPPDGEGDILTFDVDNLRLAHPQEAEGYGLLAHTSAQSLRELEVDVTFADQQRRLQSVKHSVDGFSFDSFCHVDLMPRKLRDMADTQPAALASAPLPADSPHRVAGPAVGLVAPAAAATATVPAAVLPAEAKPDAAPEAHGSMCLAQLPAEGGIVTVIAAPTAPMQQAP
eukprot:jgi/Tetstr1/465201/TSEL_009908.t2